jgi:hypothetical protein
MTNIDKAWHDWLQVEALAHDGGLLTTICQEYTDILNSPTKRMLNDWPATLEQWVPLDKNH